MNFIKINKSIVLVINLNSINLSKGEFGRAYDIKGNEYYIEFSSHIDNITYVENIKTKEVFDNFKVYTVSITLKDLLPKKSGGRYGHFKSFPNGIILNWRRKKYSLEHESWIYYGSIQSINGKYLTIPSGKKQNWILMNPDNTFETL